MTSWTTVDASQQHSLDKQAARQARFDEVVALHAKNWSKSRIARTLGLDRGMVHVWLKAGRLPSWQQPSGDSTVEVHGAYLRRRWDEGCHKGVRLWRESRARGFAGGASTVRDWLRPEKTAFAGFAGGLRRDLAAVRAALSLSWSTGPVEGQICRLKAIKRTMRGRAGFDLLRHRILGSFAQRYVKRHGPAQEALKSAVYEENRRRQGSW